MSSCDRHRDPQCRPVWLTACAAAVLLVSQASARADQLLPWTDPWTVTFNQTIPLGNKPAVFDGIDPIWYCGTAAQSCEADEGPLRAAFRYTWDWNTVSPLAAAGSIQLRADDYYALYVNRRLAGSNWLDTLPADGFATHDFGSLLNLDGSNEILVFACDGRSTDNSGIAALPVLGPDLMLGWQGCPNRSPLGNHYLLVNGQVSLFSSQVGVDPVRQSLRGGEPSDWQVSAVPEPGSLALALAALAAAWLPRRRQVAQTSA